MLLLGEMRSLIQIEDMFSFGNVMRPSLIEGRALCWMQETLSTQRDVAKHKEYLYVNLLLFIGLVSSISYYLYSKSRQKNNLVAKERNLVREREYIFDLVEKYKHVSSDLITQLPLLV